MEKGAGQVELVKRTEVVVDGRVYDGCWDKRIERKYEVDIINCEAKADG